MVREPVDTLEPPVFVLLFGGGGRIVAGAENLRGGDGNKAGVDLAFLGFVLVFKGFDFMAGLTMESLVAVGLTFFPLSFYLLTQFASNYFASRIVLWSAVIMVLGFLSIFFLLFLLFFVGTLEIDLADGVCFGVGLLFFVFFVFFVTFLTMNLNNLIEDDDNKGI